MQITKIIADPNQPRKDFNRTLLNRLKSSMERFGIKNSITVKKVGDKYMLIDGERRFRMAQELGWKEIPDDKINIEKPESEIDEIVLQFHLQETHAGWTATEKAMALYNLCNKMNISINKASEMLGIDPMSAREYMNFAKLTNKDLFVKHELPLKYANRILGTVKTAKAVYEKANKDEFTPRMKSELETVIMNKIKSGDIESENELGKVKDSFVQDPKSIQKFIKTNISASKLYIDTEAEAVGHWRAIAGQIGYTVNHINRLLESGIDVTMFADGKEYGSGITNLKKLHLVLGKLIDKMAE